MYDVSKIPTNCRSVRDELYAMQLKVLWRWAVIELTATSTTPHLDAELLIADALGLTRAQLYGQPEARYLSADQQRSIQNKVKRRKNGEPMAYLRGEQEFWSLTLKVDERVLIPRPETELLVELLLTHCPPQKNIKLAELGTGSGAIALALASERPNWKIVASDFSAEALQLANDNLQRHGLLNVELRHGDWCQAFSAHEYFDVVVSNPPYLAENDPHLSSESSLAFEPKTALIAGKNGLEDLEKIIQQARAYLLKSGQLFLEHGCEQAPRVTQLFTKYGYQTIQSYADLAGHLRVTSGKWH
jgi:release factor glutamine methyltransferase